MAALVMGTQPLLTAGLAVGPHRGADRLADGGRVRCSGFPRRDPRHPSHKLAGAVRPIRRGSRSAVVMRGSVAMTLSGVLYQKRWCAHIDLVTGSAVQLAFAGVACLVVAWWNR